MHLLLVIKMDHSSLVFKTSAKNLIFYTLVNYKALSELIWCVQLEQPY